MDEGIQTWRHPDTAIPVEARRSGGHDLTRPEGTPVRRCLSHVECARVRELCNTDDALPVLQHGPKVALDWHRQALELARVICQMRHRPATRVKSLVQVLCLLPPARGTIQHSRTYKCGQDAKGRSDHPYHIGSLRQRHTH